MPIQTSVGMLYRVRTSLFSRLQTRLWKAKVAVSEIMVTKAEVSMDQHQQLPLEKQREPQNHTPNQVPVLNHRFKKNLLPRHLSSHWQSTRETKGGDMRESRRNGTTSVVRVTGIASTRGAH